MSTYNECPQKYKFRYVHFIPEQPKYYFAFGSAMHAVMEFVHDPSHASFPTLEQALARFSAEWDKTTFAQKGYASVDKELEGYAEGRRIIEAYYDKNSADFVRPLSVEMRSTLEIDGLSMVSILDRMDYMGNGLVKILDYKTGKTIQREPDQLYLYQKIAENSPIIKQIVQQKDPSVKTVRVGALSFYHLPTLHEMTFDRADENEINDFWHRVLATAEKVRMGEFPPAPSESKCRWCDYRNICPVFTGKEYDGPNGLAAKNLLSIAPDMQPALAQPAAVQPALAKTTPLPKTPQELLSEKIDRFGALSDEIKALRAEILQLMREQHFTRHFGAQYKAELAEKEIFEFENSEQIVALLKRLGLWEKTLVPTKTPIAALLPAPSVPQAGKEALGQLIRKIKDIVLCVEKTDA